MEFDQNMERKTYDREREETYRKYCRFCYCWGWKLWMLLEKQASHASCRTNYPAINKKQWGRRRGGLFKVNQLNSPEHCVLTSTLSNCQLFLCFGITRYLSDYEPSPANVLHLIDVLLIEINLATLKIGVPEWNYRIQQWSNMSKYNFFFCTKRPVVPSWSQHSQIVQMAHRHKGINWWHLLISKGSAHSLWSGILSSAYRTIQTCKAL